MPRQKLTTLKPFSYAGRSMRTNTDFEASGRDARILVAIGKASYQTRVMTAAPPVSAPAPSPIPAPMPAPLEPAEPDIDSAGAAWDETLHVSTRLKNADGTWRKRPGATRVASE